MKDIKVSVEAETKELVIREGAAIPYIEPLKVQLKGTISAPRLFVEKRKSTIEPLQANVVSDPNKGTIILTVEEKEAKGTIITGELKINPYLLEFKINSEISFGLKEIQKFLRMRRVFFKNREQNEVLLKKLSEFFAKITIEINQKDDRKGNTLDSIQSRVTHEIPLQFTLAMPIYQDFPDKTFLVEIIADITDANVKFSFESVELAELLESDKKSILETELKSLSEYVIITV